jgi:LacI family transcriptional regulator
MSRTFGRSGMRQVADRAGVAVSSVSRVLSGHPDVSEVMRHRVLDAVAALGYEPNLLAQSLRTGTTQTIGFVVGDISNPLLAQIALGAETELSAAGYTMLLANSRNDPALDASHIALLRQRRVDGLMLSLADETSAGTITALERAELPATLVDREAGSGLGAVLSDHSHGMTEAVQHLLGLGHRRIALISGSPRVRPTRERVAALRKACRAADATATVRSGSFTAEHGARATDELMSARQPPTAIIAGGNQILAGVLEQLRERGIGVPDQVSLVTCDDVPLAAFLQPPIATISRDPGLMGQVAAKLLLELLGGAAPRTELLPTSFRPTRSCAKPRP